MNRFLPRQILKRISLTSTQLMQHVQSYGQIHKHTFLCRRQFVALPSLAEWHISQFHTYSLIRIKKKLPIRNLHSIIIHLPAFNIDIFIVKRFLCVSKLKFKNVFSLFHFSLLSQWTHLIEKKKRTHTKKIKTSKYHYNFTEINRSIANNPKILNRFGFGRPYSRR